MSDIVFDILLFLEYLEGSTVKLNGFLGNDFYSPLFGNVTCAMYSSSSDVCDQYVKYHHWFAILTLFFIYLPSVNVIATLYGPMSAGVVGMKISLGTAVVGGVFALINYPCPAQQHPSLVGFFIILSLGILVMSLVNVFSDHTDEEVISLLHYIMLRSFPSSPSPRSSSS